MTPKIFESTLHVTKEHTDEIQHVNNVVYLQWVQDIAKQHWEHKTTLHIRETYIWVVLTHYIAYHHPAFEGDELLVQTWVDDFHGAKSERHTNIIQTQSQKSIVTAKTNWCLLHKKMLRPARIPQKISTLFL